MLKPLTPRLGTGLHGNAPAPAGTRAEQPRMGDGRRLDDHVGYRFAVLAAPGVALPYTTMLRLAEMDAALVQADGEAADYLKRLGTRGGRHSSRSACARHRCVTPTNSRR